MASGVRPRAAGSLRACCLCRLAGFGGLILVGETPGPGNPGTAVGSARVSPADQKTGLDGQVARVTAWATGRGITAGRVVTETGSALNGKRGKFLALLRDPSVTMIVVGHRDRFARFGAEYAGPAPSPRPGAGWLWWTRPTLTMTWCGT